MDSSQSFGDIYTLKSHAIKTKWQGAFISETGFPPSRFIPDTYFINDGHARIYNDSLLYLSPENHYSTLIRLIMPNSVTINGDSLNFTASVKNSADASLFDPYYGCDVTMYIKGETNQVSVNTTVTNHINPQAYKRALIQMGNSSVYVPGLQHNFVDFDTLVVQTFNFGTIAYRNDTYTGGLSYGNEKPIGRVKEIGIIFKGSGYIDFIQLIYSVNSRMFMSEDFNTDGESNIIVHRW